LNDLNFFKIGNVLHPGRTTKPFWIFGDYVTSKSMKGADFDVVAIFTNEFYQPLAHLPCRRLGKSEGENGAGVCIGLFQDVGDSGGQYLGFAGTGAGEDQDWTFNGIDSSFLVVI
jgi:hypothetical protein